MAISRAVIERPEPALSWSPTITRRSGAAKGSGRSRMPSTSEKMAVVAPIPSASVRITVSAKPGDLRSWRKAKNKERAADINHSPRPEVSFRNSRRVHFKPTTETRRPRENCDLVSDSGDSGDFGDLAASGLD